jgi:hypothetical protein
MSSITTIQIEKDTRDMLKDFGHKGETYDELIKRLLMTAKRAAFFQELDDILENEEFVPLDEI